MIQFGEGLRYEKFSVSGSNLYRGIGGVAHAAWKGGVEINNRTTQQVIMQGSLLKRYSFKIKVPQGVIRPSVVCQTIQANFMKEQIDDALLIFALSNGTTPYFTCSKTSGVSRKTIIIKEEAGKIIIGYVN